MNLIAIACALALLGAARADARSTAAPFLEPFKTSVPVTDRKLLAGPWRQIEQDGKAVHRGKAYHLEFMYPGGDTFVAAKGCAVSQGTLEPVGNGFWLVNRSTGFGLEGCREIVADARVAPFDADQVLLRLARDRLTATSGGRSASFQRVSVDRSVAPDAFLRGRWLLASRKGRVLAGRQRSMLTLGDGMFRIEGRCAFSQSNGYFADQGRVVRRGGDQELRNNASCPVPSIGDEMALYPNRLHLVALPTKGWIEATFKGRLYRFVRTPNSRGKIDCTALPFTRVPDPFILPLATFENV